VITYQLTTGKFNISLLLFFFKAFVTKEISKKTDF